MAAAVGVATCASGGVSTLPLCRRIVQAAKRSGRHWGFCKANFLSASTLSQIDEMRGQVVDTLVR